MRSVACFLLAAVLAPVAAAHGTTIHASADGDLCLPSATPVDTPCGVDVSEEQGDPHVVVTVEGPLAFETLECFLDGPCPFPARAVRRVIECATAGAPCGPPVGPITVVTEVWIDSNGCEGLQRGPTAGCPDPDRLVVSNSGSLP